MSRYFLAALALSLSLSASAQWAKVFTTTPDLTSQMAQTAVQASQTGSANVTFNLSKRYQLVDGFGYAMTYASCYNLLKMPYEARQELLKRTFSPNEGYGVGYVRISIGSCDFSSREYSLCDTKGPDDNLLRDFGLTSDENDNVIPILKEILVYNPDLKIIASPWSPPRWMKTNNNWTNGELRSQYYDAYGEYFVRFIQAFADNGIRIHAVTVQNEPLNRGNSSSCYMPWQTQADFVKSSLAPKFKQAGLTTKIYLYDHNYNYDNDGGQEDYSYKAFQRMGNDFEGHELVAGTAWHKYTGYANDWQEMNDIFDKTGKENIFTEATIGDWNGEFDLNASLSRDMRDLVIHPALGRCRASIVWNFMLDANRGPNRPGGCQTASGAVNLRNDNTHYSYTSHYFIMTHASAVVDPRAQRVDLSWDVAGTDMVAYANPDGSFALLVSNMSYDRQTARVKLGDYVYTIPLPARSIVSTRLGLDQEGASSGEIVIPEIKTVVYYDNTLTQWETPHVFTWGDNGNNGWPGAKMTYVSHQIWKYEVPQGHEMMVFNAGDGDPTKSPDMRIEGDHLYDNTADIVELDTRLLYGEIEFPNRYISGEFNGWTEPGASGSLAMTLDDGVYKASVNFNGQGRFCIYGPHWNPKFCVFESTPTISGEISYIRMRQVNNAPQEADVHYNLNGNYDVYFDPFTLMLSVVKPGNSPILPEPEPEPEEGALTTLEISTPLPGDVFFTLTGARVINPLPGNIYIVRRGPSVFKYRY